MANDPPPARFTPRLLADTAAAACTALAISPTVCLIDSAVISKASTGLPLLRTLSQILHPPSSIPRQLLSSPAARLVLLVYFGTYATANILDTVTKEYNTRNAGTIRFTSTTAVSTALTIYKDSRLVRIFGRKGGASTVVPASSYALFTLRDAITIAASFSLPPMLAPHLSGMIDLETRRLKAAQFAIPAAVQFLTTPIHLLGINLYNSREREGLGKRLRDVKRDVPAAVGARIVRIIPAFSLGGILNIELRERFARFGDGWTLLDGIGEKKRM